MTDPISLPTILIADDDPNLLFSLKEVFARASFNVHTARNGAEALQRIFMLRPDLIICDLNMPHPNGFEVQRILRCNPETEMTPFVFLTASSSKADILFGYESGADEFVTKPFDPDVLLAKINRLLGRARRVAETAKAALTTRDPSRIAMQEEQILAIKRLSDSILGGIEVSAALRQTLASLCVALGAQAVELWWQNDASGTIEFHSGVQVEWEMVEGRSERNFQTLEAPFDSQLTDSLYEAHDFPALIGGEQRGTIWVYQNFNEAVTQSAFIETLMDMISILMEKKKNFAQMESVRHKKDDYVIKLLEGLAHALELRDHETGNHSLRVVALTDKLARRYGFAGAELENIRIGAMAHDIGKIGVPDMILTKAGPLTEEEWKVMRMHPYYAVELLSRFDFLARALDIPLYHHERWDGKGYPFGLAGDRIPFAAQLFGIVDTWDALTNDRVYRPALTAAAAMDIIDGETGKAFRPDIVKEFKALLKEMGTL